MHSYELIDYRRHYGPGSHMPIDVTTHWSIRNPLNILLVLIIFVLIIAMTGLV